MTQEEKGLLLKDLCGRLPYGVILNIDNGKYREDKELWPGLFDFDDLWDAKPYLRPMSSMTKEEDKEFWEIINNYGSDTNAFDGFELGDDIDWLNIHHFDYRGLIEKGLALEAPEGMYQ